MIRPGARILLLEDEPIIAMTLADLLEDRGCTVHLAHSLSAASDAIEDGEFDAAILDINIAGNKSYGVAERLLHLAVPFVFASGYGDATHPAHLRNVPTVAKPYRLPSIAAALASCRKDGG